MFAPRHSGNRTRTESDRLIRLALIEDLGPDARDLTSDVTVDGARPACGEIVQKMPGVVFGLDVAWRCFVSLGEACELTAEVEEAAWNDDVPKAVARVSGPAGSLLAAERTALNLLGHLSGIATATARMVDACRGTGATILDTRKTLPGLRALEKAAVAAGGGQNHRMGLYDAVLIKDNHIALAGGVASAVAAARRSLPASVPIEVEVGSPDDAAIAALAGADRLLLDNMAVGDIAAIQQAFGSTVELEVSGGVTLKTVREIALTGVQFISVGAITHSAPALDLSLRLHHA